MSFKLEQYLTLTKVRLALKVCQLFQAKDREPQHLAFEFYRRLPIGPNPNQVKQEKI